MSSVKRFCFLALIAATIGPGVRSSFQPGVQPDGVQSSVQSQSPAADATATEDLVRSYGGSLCTNADSPSTCLFKGLLKGALLYVTRRRNAVVTDKVGVDATAAGGPLQQPKGIEEYLIEQVKNILGLFSFGIDLPAEITSPWSMLKSSFLDGRGKKNKNLGPMLAAGAAMMAGTLMPLAFGALAMLAGKAIMTSLLAITISGMLGLKALFSKNEGSAHVYKSYSAVPAHYAEAQYEQELGLYKGQTEAKMHSYYAGDSNLSAYYKGSEQQVNESGQPEYYAVGAGSVNPKFVGSGHRAHSDVVDNNINANEKVTVVNNGNKIISERIG